MSGLPFVSSSFPLNCPLEVVGIDLPGAEIADQEVVAELAETAFDNGPLPTVIGGVPTTSCQRRSVSQTCRRW